MTETADVQYCYRHPDRETGLSCSECGRPICYECMTPAPVGIRCPEHSGKPQGVARVTEGVRRAGSEGTGAAVVRVLIALNVAIFLVNLAQGAGLDRNRGALFEDWALIGEALTLDGRIIGVAQGEWWRLLTSAFLHGSLIHLGMNMVMLWWIGAPMEAALGRGRFLALYLVSGLAGAAGALLLTEPNRPTVGASGAIFGILGAALVFERQRNYVLGGSALGLIVLNLVFTVVGGTLGNISIGGHLGGFAGGALVGLALGRFGRGHASYGRLGIVGTLGVLGVGVLSLALVYYRVQGYA